MNFSKVGRQPEKIRGSMTPSIKVSFYSLRRLKTVSAVVGASSTEWDVSASTSIYGHKTVFQAVSNYPVSVYKASTAFHDIAALDVPPRLVSVVASKSEMGANFSLRSQAGKVVEVRVEDAMLKDLAA